MTDILGTFFSGYWFWASIPTCIIIFLLIIHNLSLIRRKRKMKTWKLRDSILIIYNFNASDNSVYQEACRVSSNDKPSAILKKWNKYESLVEVSDGKEYFIKTKRINNYTAYNREREGDMDEFMEDNNGIKTKSERRDNAIDDVLGDKKEEGEKV